VADYPHFPRLSRHPALKTKGDYALDPTLRDDMANGMETTRAKFTRLRRQYTVTFENLTNADVAALRDFVENVAVAGANIFWITDNRDRTNPKQLMVRFSKLPSDDDAGWVQDQLRQTCMFEVREV
jgi:hypothetical protein